MAQDLQAQELKTKQRLLFFDVFLERWAYLYTVPQELVGYVQAHWEHEPPNARLGSDSLWP